MLEATEVVKENLANWTFHPQSGVRSQFLSLGLGVAIGAVGSLGLSLAFYEAHSDLGKQLQVYDNVSELVATGWKKLTE